MFYPLYLPRERKTLHLTMTQNINLTTQFIKIHNEVRGEKNHKALYNEDKMRQVAF